jgi:hypothetical protein
VAYELLLGRRQTAKRMFKSFIIVGLGYTPWIVPLYNQTKMVGGGFWLGTPTFTDLRTLFYDYLGQGIKNRDLQLPLLNMPFYEVALYLTLATVILRKWWRTIKKNIFLVIWFAGPIVLTWIVSQKFQSIFFNRYLLYVIPAGMLLLASNRNKISIGLIAALIVSFGIIDYNYFTHPTKLPFRSWLST